jgi:exopolysaccharide biosynthesis polyprenyl glycosylphosphotransferase
MIKEQTTLVNRLSVTIDAVVVSLAFFLSYHLRGSYLDFGEPLFPIGEYLPVFLAVVPFWISFSYILGLYGDQRARTRTREIFQVMKAGLLQFAAISMLAFLFKLTFMSRIFIILFVASSTFLVAVERFILLTVLRHYHRLGRNARNIAILGSDDAAMAIEGVIHLHSEWGLRFAGYIVDNDGADTPGLSPRLGRIDELERILRENVIDEVIFAASHEKLEEFEDELLVCEELGVSTKVMLNIFSHRIAQAEVEELGNMTMLSFSATPRSLLQLAAKRALDVGVSFCALALLSPLMIIAAAAIKLTSRGPVFFRQVRCGKNGREFKLMKFRSMVKDAENMQDGLKHLNEMEEPAFKIKNDPRITGVGKVIRRTSIDELPQFLNVLAGDMSLVGPRPPLPSEVAKYERWQRRRLSIRPGITCYWQISGRNKVDFATWMKMDLDYIDNWSLGEDFRIILKTIPAVLLGRGAS